MFQLEQPRVLKSHKRPPTGHNLGQLHEEHNHGEENGDAERELFARVGWQREAEQCHRGDDHTRHDQVEAVVQGAPAEADAEGDVDVGVGTTVVQLLVSLAGQREQHPLAVRNVGGDVAVFVVNLQVQCICLVSG